MHQEWVKHLEQLARYRASHADVWCRLGLALHDGGRFAEALAAFDRALALNARYADATLARSFVLGDLDRAREGYAALRPLLATAPDDHSVVFGIGVFCMRHGWLDTGVAQLRRAVGLLPGAAYQRSFLAAALEQVGDHAEAVIEQRHACDLARRHAARLGDFATTYEVDTEFPGSWPATGNARAMVEFAQFLMQKDDASAARAALMRVHARFPGHPTVLVETGRMEALLDRHDAADWFRAALDVDATCHVAHIELSLIAAEQSRMDDAVTHLRAAVELRPTFPDYRCDFGTLLLDLGRMEEAIVQLEQACVLSPADGHAALRLAMAYLEHGRFVDAHRMLDSGTWRDWTEAMVVDAEISVRSGDLAHARAVLEQALARDPQHPTVLDALAALSA